MHRNQSPNCMIEELVEQCATLYFMKCTLLYLCTVKIISIVWCKNDVTNSVRDIFFFTTRFSIINFSSCYLHHIDWNILRKGRSFRCFQNLSLVTQFTIHTYQLLFFGMKLVPCCYRVTFYNVNSTWTKQHSMRGYSWMSASCFRIRNDFAFSTSISQQLKDFYTTVLFSGSHQWRFPWE